MCIVEKCPTVSFPPSQLLHSSLLSSYFIGTLHPVSQIQQGGVFQQSSNKLKKENDALIVIGPIDPTELFVLMQILV